MPATSKAGRKVLAFPGLAGKFGRVAAAAIFDLRLSAEALRVLTVLSTYANTAGRCFPSVGTIAERLRCKPRVVQYHLRRLEEFGYVIVEPQAGTGRSGWATNTYILTFPEGPATERQAAANDGDGVQPDCTPQGPDGVQPDCTPPGRDGVQPDCTGGVQFGDRMGCNPIAPKLDQITRPSNSAGGGAIVEKPIEALALQAAIAGGIERSVAQSLLLKVPSATRDRLLSLQASGNLDSIYLANVLQSAAELAGDHGKE